MSLFVRTVEKIVYKEAQDLYAPWEGKTVFHKDYNGKWNKSKVDGYEIRYVRGVSTFNLVVDKYRSVDPKDCRLEPPSIEDF